MPGLLGVGVVEALEVPAAVGGELGDAVAALGDQLPEPCGGGDPARVAAGHADDRDRLLARLGPEDDLLRGAARGRLGEQVLGEGGGVGVVEDDGAPAGAGRRSARAGCAARPRQRVEAELLEGPAGLDLLRPRRGRGRRRPAPGRGRGRRPPRSASGRVASLAAERARAALRRRGVRTRPRRIGGRAPTEASALRAAVSIGTASACGRSAPSAASKRPGPLVGERLDATAPHPLQVGLGQLASPCRPRAPRGPRRSRWPAGPRPGAAERGRRGRRWRRRSWPGRVRRGCPRRRRRGRRRRDPAPAVSSCRFQAASPWGAKTRSSCSGAIVSTVAVVEGAGAVDDRAQRVLARGSRRGAPPAPCDRMTSQAANRRLGAQLLELCLQLLRPVGLADRCG